MENRFIVGAVFFFEGKSIGKNQSRAFVVEGPERALIMADCNGMAVECAAYPLAHEILYC